MLQWITFCVYHFLCLPLYFRPRFLNFWLLGWREVRILFHYIFLAVLKYRKYCNILCIFDAILNFFLRTWGHKLIFIFIIIIIVFEAINKFMDVCISIIYRHNFLLWKLILTRDYPYTSLSPPVHQSQHHNYQVNLSLLPQISPSLAL